MGLVLAALFLAIFVGNVVWGSVTGDSPLSDVAEMVILFCASIAFVASILRLEAREKAKNTDTDS